MLAFLIIPVIFGKHSVLWTWQDQVIVELVSRDTSEAVSEMLGKTVSTSTDRLWTLLAIMNLPSSCRFKSFVMFKTEMKLLWWVSISLLALSWVVMFSLRVLLSFNNHFRQSNRLTCISNTDHFPWSFFIPPCEVDLGIWNVRHIFE